ncbi:hypothetical protein CC78DRAFT_582242 [Lojkania enalia]|uniref:Uncharacterized protein n=1 Tax=Lojkania enalia TaxID=147567 RepID=A0A9P4N535_9PLEO|nr:hypothetical protein CC78DRAFT_582242 [Didymosphaeria enalia]
MWTTQTPPPPSFRDTNKTNMLSSWFGLPENETWTVKSPKMQLSVNDEAGIILEYSCMSGSIPINQADVVLIDDTTTRPTLEPTLHSPFSRAWVAHTTSPSSATWASVSSSIDSTSTLHSKSPTPTCRSSTGKDTPSTRPPIKPTPISPSSLVAHSPSKTALGPHAPSPSPWARAQAPSSSPPAPLSTVNTLANSILKCTPLTSSTQPYIRGQLPVAAIDGASSTKW